MFSKSQLWILVILVLSFKANAQIIDDFSDGDLSINPSWSGEISNFNYDTGTGLLRSQGPKSITSYHISTANNFINRTSWEFRIIMNLSPSGSNNMRVFLVSDQADLLGNLNGYFLQLGEAGSDDGIDLYKKSGATETKLADGPNGQVAISPDFRIKVIRDEAGTWSIEVDLSGGTDFEPILTFTDNTFINTSYFGVVVNQTSSNWNNYYFGDVIIEQLKVVSLRPASSNILEIVFDQELPKSEIESVSNYQLENNTVLSVEQDASHPDKAILHLAENLNSGEFELTISAALTLNDEIAYPFSYTQLELEDVITSSSTEIRLLFNDDAQEGLSVDDFSIDNGIGSPEAIQINPLNPREVILTLGINLVEQPYILSLVNGLQNLIGNSQIEAGFQRTFEFIIPLIAETVEVADKRSLLISFNKTLEPTVAENPLHYDVSPGIGTPISATLAASGKSVLLVFDSEFVDKTYTLSINNLTDDSGIALQPDPTVMDFAYLPLEVISVGASDENKLTLTFNQEVDLSTAQSVGNYSLNDGFGVPASAVLSESAPNTVELTFSESLFNFTYELAIDGVTNAAGNAVAEEIILEVVVNKATPAGALVITEIFADPNPKGILPELQILPTASTAEFVEVLNTTTHSISLSGFSVTGGSIGNISVAPGGYLLLVPQSHLSEYELFGNAIAVSGWNTLTNSGEQIVLTDQLGNVLDDVTFSSSWYNNPQKDGGWSIEKINPLPACETSNNWAASTDEKGATPGAQNSVFNDTPDTAGPEILTVEVIDEQTLLIGFNEKMETGSLETGIVTLNGYTITQQVASGVQAVELQLNMPLVSELEYTLEVSGFLDCAGNLMTPKQFSFYYDIKGPVLQKLVVRSFSSLLLVFDEPLKKSVSETEENYLLTTEIQIPASAKITPERQGEILLEFEHEFSIGLNYELAVSNLQDTLGNVMLPDFQVGFNVDQQIDTVWVEGPNFLSVVFTEAINNLSLGATENYLLDEVAPGEVIIKNQDEARLIFSENFPENKDLTFSVSNLLGLFGNYLITPDYTISYDTRAPVVDTLEVLNETEVLVVYNEEVAESSSEILTSYLLNGAVHPLSTKRQAARRSVLLTFENAFRVEERQELSIEKVKDIFGNEIKTTIKQVFVYDTLAPSVDQVVVTGPFGLNIFFSEPVTAAPVELPNFSLSGEHPVEAVRHLPDSFIVSLQFDFPIPPESELGIDGITDFYGNTSSGITYQLSNAALTPAEVAIHSERSVEVSFNKDLGSFSIENVLSESLAISHVSAGSKSNALLLESSSKFEDGAAYSLHFEGLVSQTGEAPGELDSVQFTYYSFVDKLISNNSEYAELHLSVATQPDSLVSAAFAVQPGNLLPAFFIPDAKNSSIIRLYFDGEMPQNQPLQLEFSDLYDEWSRKVPDQNLSFIIDTDKPEVDTVLSRLLTRLLVEFSEPVISVSGLAPNHYELIDIGLPAEVAAINATGRSFLLSFEHSFTDNQQYQLVVKRVEDGAGNLIEPDTISFLFHHPFIPQAGDLLISEIMADPTPAVGLPEAEYVEIFNNTTTTIDLSTIIFSDDAKSFALEGMLETGEYLVLCPPQNTDSFEEYGKVQGLAGWSALSNTGDSLTLSNFLGETIDQVVYHSSWYQSTAKDDGGYSLERIYAEPVCEPNLNWTASMNETGGTPGTENAAWNKATDTEAPFISSVAVVSAKELKVSFNEPLNSHSIGPAGFQFSPELPIQTVEITDVSEVLITLAEGLKVSDIYTLSATGIQDCFGNEIEPAFISFAIGEAIAAGDIIFTEIMADPAPAVGLPEVEYVEIFNRSGKLINLQQLQYEDEGTSISLSGFLSPGEYRLIVASANKALFETNVLGLSSFPSITNSSEHLTLKDTSGTVIDELTFDLSWYQNTAKDDGGYSLERIYAEPLCEPNLNWTASMNETGGTPGTENAVWNKAADTEAPLISSVALVSANELKISFNEPLNSPTIAAASFHFFPEVLVQAVEVTDASEVLIALAEELSVSDIYTLSATGIQDCFGNQSDPVSTSFAIGESVAAGDIIFTEIMADPAPAVRLPEAEYVEILNSSEKLINLQQLVYEDEGSSTPLSGFIGPGEYRLIAASSNKTLFETDKVLGLSSFPSITNSGEHLTLKDTSGTVIDELTFDLSWYQNTAKDDGGYSLERINLNLVCSGPSNWSSSADPSGGSPGRANSVNSILPDKDPPTLVDVKVQSDSTIVLLFSKGLDASVVEAASIKIDGGPSIVSVQMDDIHKEQLIVELNEKLSFGREYLLQVQEVVDCEGNVLDQTEARFGVGRPPSFGELIISEIMADPEPSAGLPEAEFIEIYNRSSDWISLGGVTLIIGSKSIALQEATLAPKEYLVLASTNSISLFNEYGDILGVPSFPTLKNDGDDIALYQAHQIIHAVTYKPTLIKEAMKREGGWSLEIVDSSLPCAGEENWAASVENLGGSPGKKNSVNATLGDGFGPGIQEVIAKSELTLFVRFSERLLFESLNLEAAIVPETSVKSTWSDQPVSDILHLELGEQLQPNTTYKLTLSGLVDCVGNLPVAEKTTASFILPAQADSLDLLINEVLFNPRSGGVDFVEVFNTSEKFIDLQGWKLGNVIASTGLAGNFQVISTSPHLIGPGEFKVFTESPTILKADYPSGKEDTFIELGLPSYPNSAGGVVLANEAGQIMDSLNYSEDYHSSFLKEVRGVSLERVSLEAATNDPENWKSATSAAGFATPGFKNSNHREAIETENLLVAEPRAIIGGQGSIYFYFANSLSNTRLSARIYDLHGRVVKTLLDGQTVGQGGFLSWDGASNTGELVRMGIYIVQLEFFNTTGQQEVVRTTVAVGGRF